MSEPDVSNLISVAQAVAIIDAARVTPRITRVPLGEAMGRRLAEPLLADRDFPAFDKSQMDGYAVRCTDVAAAGAELAVVGEVAAGTAFDRELQPGQAVAIMTGAPMPAGADGVLPVEDSQRLGEDRVRFTKPAVRGRYVAPRGSDAREKQLVLARGEQLDAVQLAVAASVGAADVSVFERPRVAVLSTGNELVAVDQPPGPNQIRNSNSVMLVALLRKLGCEVTDVGNAPDEPGLIRAAVDEGLKHDVLFVTGGMSMGTHDHVPAVLQDAGFELKITKLRVKPGKPFVFGVRTSAEDESARGQFVFGLPGNPVSGFVCTVRLASRLLARLGGGEPREKWLAGRIDTGMAPNGPREFYQPVVWSSVQGGTSARSEFATVTPLNWKGSADLFTLAKANALLVRPENEPPLGKGTLVRVLEI